jgi:hypothetical protein
MVAIFDNLEIYSFKSALRWSLYYFNKICAKRLWKGKICLHENPLILLFEIQNFNLLYSIKIEQNNLI